MLYLAKERFHLRASSEMILVRFIASLGFATLTAGVSVYMRDIGLSDAWIGVVGGLASLMVVLTAPLTPYLLERFNEIKLYASMTLVFSALSILMGLSTSILLVSLLFIVARQAVSLVSSAGTVAFRDLSGSKKEFTKAQGLVSSLMNLGWVLGPFISGLLLATYDVNSPIIIGSLIMILSTISLVVMPIKLPAKKHVELDTSWGENLRFYVSKPRLRKAYVFNFGVGIWWAFLWTFLPLYMLDAGYSLQAVGFVTGLTQLPLFLFEFRTVRAIDRFGYKPIFVTAFASMTIFMLAAFVSNNIELVIAGYVLTSLSLSFLEPIKEIFLFDNVSKLNEEKAYPIYATAGFVGGIAGRLGIGVVVGILGARSSYLAMAIVMLLITYIALSLKPSQNSKT